MPKDHCIYLRKSRTDTEAEDRGEGETLARHESILIELSKKLNLNIVKVYREIVSGETIGSRPVMQQLLSEVEKGLWAGVLVIEVERLARGDTIDQGIVAQTFKYSNTKIITPIKTYDPNNEYDEEYFEFGLFMSRREYKTINRRLQRGRLAAVKEGKYVQSMPPYGYIRKKIEHKKGFTLEPHPEQSEVIKIIFDLYTVGELQKDGSYKRLGVSLIAHRLNKLKIKPLKGQTWVTSSIRDILINPVYAGKIRWNWRPTSKKMVDGRVEIGRPRTNDYIVVDGLHEAIISEKTFNLAQEYISVNRAVPLPDKNTVKNPLSGLIICGKCGRRMVRRPYKNGQLDSLICQSTSCDNISSYLYLVEKSILSGLSHWVKDYEINWNNVPQVKEDNKIYLKHKQLDKLDNEISSINKQINSIYDLLEQGVYTTDKFLERNLILSERLQQAHLEKNELNKEIKTEILRIESNQSFIPKINNLLEIYNELKTPRDKNDLLKEIIEKVVYYKDKNGRWHNSPEDFNIILYPKLPMKNNSQL